MKYPTFTKALPLHPFHGLLGGMMSPTTKTTLLLAGMTAAFLTIGFSLGGRGGAMFALLMAMGMNAFSYWFSDSIALKAHRATEVDKDDNRLGEKLYKTTDYLAKRAEIPTPRVYIMNNPQPNAFATGRNPENAAVAVTTGLLEQLNWGEVTGVIAHELAHIKNRDTLIMTIAATIAGALGMLARMGSGAALRGRGRQGGAGGSLLMVLAPLIAPMAAGVVQMAVSRVREFEADRVGAKISGKPEDLASALAKIANIAPRTPNVEAERNPAMSHMFIYSPLTPSGLKKLFSTHPPAQERIEKLMAMV